MDNVAQGSHSELGLPVPILLLLKTLVSRLTHTSALFLMSTTPVAFYRVRFILSADSGNFFRKLIRIVRAHCPFHVFQSVWGYTEILPSF